MNSQYDVIVVGAGGSGMAAACSAAELGAKVLVLEQCPQPGGTTGIAVGSFTAAETNQQRLAHVHDSVAAHVEDAAKFARAEMESRNHAALREFFLSEAAETLRWLEQLGLTFVGPNPEPPNRVPRMHNVVPGAKAYIAALQIAIRSRGAELICDCPVKELLTRHGRVMGVRAERAGKSVQFTALRGVVLAAGDYANNAAIIAHYKGEQFREIEGINPFAGGAGHELAQSVGAHLLNMDITYGPELRFVPSHRKPFQQCLPASGPAARILGLVATRLPNWIMKRMIKRLLVTWQHPENALFDDGAILINQQGQRFVDETKWPEREITVASQAHKQAFILLDGRLRKRYSAWPHFISTAPDIAYAYVDDYLRLRPDVALANDELEPLLAKHNIDSSHARNAIKQFNHHACVKTPDCFGRPPAENGLKNGPWVLLGPVKAYFTTTEGGAAINQHLQVLNEQGYPIPGLFAVGQNGLGGMVLWGHGLHIAWAMTSGRLVGRAIMSANHST